MSLVSHKGQILPLANQVIPITQNTTFYANYDEDLNGTTTSGIVYPKGYEHSLRFAGKAFTTPYGAGINPFADEVIIDMWVKPDSTIQKMILSTETHGDNQRLYIGIVNNKWTIGIQDSSWDGDGTVIATDNWTHIRLEMFLGTANLYVDGELSKTQTYTSFVTAGNFRIGGTSSYEFSGLISDVKIYKNREMQVCYKLNEGESIIANDSINGNDVLIDSTNSWDYGRIIATFRTDEGRYGNAVAIESATTNLIPNSEDPSNGMMVSNGWEGYVAERVIGPTGKLDALKIVVPETGGDGFYTRTFPISGATANRVFTTSVYVKGSGEIRADLSEFGGVEMDPTDFAKGNVITLTNEWKRISSTGSIKANDRDTIHARLRGFSGGRELYIWHPQVEENNFPTSYTPSQRGAGFLSYPREVLNLSSFTFNAWVKINSYTNKSQPIFEMSASVTQRMSFSHNSSTNKLGLYITGSGDITSEKVPPIREWYMATLTYDGTTYKIYYNGEEIASKEAIPYDITPEDEFYIGGKNLGALDGFIDSVRIDKTVATPSEILSWYVGGPHYNAAY